MSRPCACEDQVLAVVAASTPTLPASLAAHVAACEDCRVLLALASGLREEHALAMAAARVPSAGQVWWRAELRARQEAAMAATRPITFATGLAAAALAGLLVSVGGALAWWLRERVVALGRHFDWLPTAPLSDWPAPGGVWLAVLLVVGVMVVATPLVLYAATRDP